MNPAGATPDMSNWSNCRDSRMSLSSSKQQPPIIYFKAASGQTDDPATNSSGHHTAAPATTGAVAAAGTSPTATPREGTLASSGPSAAQPARQLPVACQNRQIRLDA